MFKVGQAGTGTTGRTNQIWKWQALKLKCLTRYQIGLCSGLIWQPGQSTNDILQYLSWAYCLEIFFLLLKIKSLKYELPKLKSYKRLWCQFHYFDFFYANGISQFWCDYCDKTLELLVKYFSNIIIKVISLCLKWSFTE